MQAWITPELSLTLQGLVASFKLGTLRPLRAFQRMLGLMAAASSVIPLGLCGLSSLGSKPMSRPMPGAWAGFTSG